MSPRNDPYAQFNFLVLLDGVASAGFTEVSGLNTESDIVEYREGNYVGGVHKLPGLVKFGQLTLKRGYTLNQDLWLWRKTTLEGATERRNGAIVLLDEAREPTLRWEFFEAWVSKYEGPALNATTSEAAIESIELAFENLQLAE
ncbi:phage tail protein [Glutamicibacter sp. MNS18]|uniref:phage tail protein n=1 Tax=Glutamicibacter sp. MNS18 TaxID=2989817 RepID=UPI0022356EC2|nr:phage tail protein [Glutamicibacter sp. MNS18]MCW4464567.1 phage tail protein [Glutamicibacter sp. MNS18]